MMELGPLPEPLVSEGVVTTKDGRYVGSVDGYTAGQMRAYAAAEVAKERARCALICEKSRERARDGADVDWQDGYNAALSEAAFAIRSTQ